MDREAFDRSHNQCWGDRSPPGYFDLASGFLCERGGDGIPSRRLSKDGVLVRTAPFSLHKVAVSNRRSG